MTLIEIPAELAAEVTEHPERFKPSVRQGQRVLVLGRANAALPVGEIVTADFDLLPGDDVLSTSRISSEGLGIAATAWAIVGGFQLPRVQPLIGARILVLGAAKVSAAAGKIGRVTSVHLGLPVVQFAELVLNDDEDQDPEGWCVDHWAFLPALERAEPGSLVDTDPDLSARMAEADARARAATDPGWFVPRSRRDALLSGSRPPVGPAGFEDTDLPAQALAVENPGRARQRLLLSARDEIDQLLAMDSTGLLSGDTAANEALARSNGEWARKYSVRLEENRLLKQRLAAAEADVIRLTNALTTMAADRDQRRADAEKWEQRAREANAAATELEDWQNGIADRMPEEYDGEESQDSIIEKWLNELSLLAEPVARAVAPLWDRDVEAGMPDSVTVVIPIPQVDPAREQLLGAAYRISQNRPQEVEPRG